MNTTLRRIWLQLTTNRKQFSILCVMVGLGLLLWARLIIVSSMPKMALADEAAGTMAPVDRPSDAVDTPTPDKNRSGVVQIALDGAPVRDPFRVSSRYFPESSEKDQNLGDSGKSGSEEVENLQRSEAHLQARLRGQADLLTLDAVMTNMAVINGEIYRPDDAIAGVSDESIRFRLMEIRKRSVVLDYEGRTFELRIETPGG